MSRFATVAPKSKVARPTNTVNLAGATAYTQEAKLELASIVTTSFVTDQFYRGADTTIDRMVELLSAVDPYFAAQAAVYARNADGMRSITHVLAAELAARVKGEEWMKRFLHAVVRRPDDATEILAYYLAVYGKPLPNSLKKGLGSALGKFDEYQLAKYRGDGKALSLVDVVNLTHPKPTARNAEALTKLVNGTLRNEKTWEAKLSKAGPAKEAKADAWAEQLADGSIGQLALLRNLRNIAEQAPHLVSRACELLTDDARVEKSLIFPFQYLIAYKQDGIPGPMLAALSDALDKSIAVVPDLGDTLVAVDGSGSMGQPIAGGGVECYEAAALFGAVYFKKTQGAAAVGIFENDFDLVKRLNPGDSTLTLTRQICAGRRGYATNFRAIFTRTRKKYDSVVIFSDMQANLGTGHSGLSEYRKRTGANPNVFAFDLAGYGSSQFDPRAKTFQLAGFSDKSFGLLGKLSEDPNALVSAIAATTF